MSTKLDVGEEAPDFCVKNQDGEGLCLHDFRGRNVVLYFYPKDNTPGCSLEAMQFTKYKQEFEEYNTTILGVSKDSCESHRRFIKNKDLNITLLSDENREVNNMYGVWRPKKFMGREILGTVRTTFLIDKNGVIQHVWDNVKVKGHAEDVLDKVKTFVSNK